MNTIIRLSILSVCILFTGCYTTQLQIDASTGNINKVNELLEQGFDINEAGSGKRTPLMDAVRSNQIEMVTFLLEKGADINLRDDSESTALMIAVDCQVPYIIKILIDKGADINLRNYSGSTALMIAADRQEPPVVRLLLDKGADVNAKDNNGLTALHKAVIINNFSIAQMLVDKGADINIKANYKGDELTSLQLAEKEGRTQIIEILGHKQPKNTSSVQSKYMLIAVIDFEAKGVSKDDAARVSEWLRTELINTGKFKVIERSAMNAILKEQAFSAAGCTDTSCAVEMGKLLSAKKMLAGSVESWDDKIIISGRIIDVEKGIAEFAHRETLNSRKELDSGTSNFANNLAKRINGI